MKATPAISVIVPIYKVAPFLRECIDSILAQTYSNLEIILVDDESPDESPAICEEYAKKIAAFGLYIRRTWDSVARETQE